MKRVDINYYYFRKKCPKYLSIFLMLKIRDKDNKTYSILFETKKLQISKSHAKFTYTTYYIAQQPADIPS